MSARPSLYNRIRWRLEFAIAWVILTVVTCFPRTWTTRLFRGLFGLIGPLTKANRRAEKNLERVYPNMMASEHQKIIRGVWKNFANVIFDFVYMKSLKRSFAAHPERLVVEGRGILEAVKASGKGALFFSAHAASWEIARVAALNEGIGLGMLYRAFNNPLIDRRIWDVLDVNHAPFFHKGTQGTRQMIKFLRSGGSVLILVDQKLSEGQLIPFMGHLAKTASAAPEIALKMDIPLIPVIVKREGLGRFRVIFEEPLDLEAARQTDNPAHALSVAMNRRVEAWVYDRPEEWFWLHRRWG